MRFIYLLCFLSALFSCSKQQFITNSQEKKGSGICMTLSTQQSNDHHVWQYYSYYPEKKNKVFYYFKISDFFNLEKINCSECKVEIKNIDISFRGMSTDGSKGETVGVFKYKIEISFINHNKEVLNKIYTTKTRSNPYNWNLQKTIRNLHSIAFSQGLREIQSMIEIDWQRLNRVN